MDHKGCFSTCGRSARLSSAEGVEATGPEGWPHLFFYFLLQTATCNSRRTSAYVVSMRKSPKVVPITPDKYRLIASDETSHRVIFGIGKQRVAFDFFTRITELPPATGDHPAPVAVIKKGRK